MPLNMAGVSEFMAYKPNQISDVFLSEPDDVAAAIAVVTELVVAKRGQFGTKEAINAIARDARLSATVVRRLFQPSRHPKDVGMRVWRGLRAAYLKYLRLRIHELQARVRRLEALGHCDDGTRAALVDEAEALVRRVKTSIR